jgi:hypothetical protein
MEVLSSEETDELKSSSNPNKLSLDVELTLEFVLVFNTASLSIGRHKRYVGDCNTYHLRLYWR